VAAVHDGALPPPDVGHGAEGKQRDKRSLHGPASRLPGQRKHHGVRAGTIAHQSLMDQRTPQGECLLAVDVGLRTGLALYRRDGRLLWYRSQHLADADALRRAVRHLLGEHQEVVVICMEGGGRFGEIWERAASARGITTRHVAAETWRGRLLLDRDQRDGRQAKRKADDVARRVIEWSAAPRPTALRHDTAEAILIGLWGVLDARWLARIPRGLCR